MLQGANQVVGDVHIGGTVHSDAVTVQDDTEVDNLNADLLDGNYADTFALADQTCPSGQVQSGVAADGTPTCIDDAGGANSIVGRSGQLGYAFAHMPTEDEYTPLTGASFNSSGGAITARRDDTGKYSMQFSGLDLEGGHVQVTRAIEDGYCNVFSWNGDKAFIRCYDEDGLLEDAVYNVMFID